MVDYNTKFIQFHSDIKFIKLQGNSNVVPQQTSLNQFQCLCNTNSIVECYIITNMDTIQVMVSKNSAMLSIQTHTTQLELPQDMPEVLRRLLLQYHQVFSIPTGLSPSKPCNHKIELIPNAQPLISLSPQLED